MKRTIALFSFLTLLILSVSTNAQQISPVQQKKVDDLYKNASVVYFEFVVSSSQEIAPLAKIVSVEGAKGTVVRAHATKDQFTKFIVKNYAYTVLPQKSTAKKPTKKKPATKKKTTATKKK